MDKTETYAKLSELATAAIGEESIVHEIVTAALKAAQEGQTYGADAPYPLYACHDLRDAAKVLSELADAAEGFDVT